MIGKVTKDVVVTGIKGVGQDYLGAVKGALTVGTDLAYPVCRDMGENGLYTSYDPWFDDRLWYFPSQEMEDFEHDGHGGYDTHYYGDYDAYLNSLYYGGHFHYDGHFHQVDPWFHHADQFD